MEKIWDNLKESVYGNVTPQDTIKLSTTVVKVLLGMFLGQSALTALWWSIKDHVFYPWLLFLSTFLQIGWFWSKVTMSWQNKQEPSSVHPLFADTVDTDCTNSINETNSSVSAPDLSIDNIKGTELRFAVDSERGPLTGSDASDKV